MRVRSSVSWAPLSGTLDDGLGQELLHRIRFGQLYEKRRGLGSERCDDRQQRIETSQVEHLFREGSPDVAATECNDGCRVLRRLFRSERVLYLVVNTAIQQWQDERLHLVVVVARSVDPHGDRVEELVPVAGIVLYKAIVCAVLGVRDGNNARIVERLHIGNRAQHRR